MTQTESTPSPENEPDPFDPKELAKKDLLSLEMLLGISEANLESKILERNKKTKELKELNAQFVAKTHLPDYDMYKDDLMSKCQAAGREQHELNLEIKRRNDQLLDIREAVVEKRHPL